MILYGTVPARQDQRLFSLSTQGLATIGTVPEDSVLLHEWGQSLIDSLSSIAFLSPDITRETPGQSLMPALQRQLTVAKINGIDKKNRLLNRQHGELRRLTHQEFCMAAA